MVTGPTVINPLLRRIRVSSPVQTVLEAEGILVDAVGALAAVVILEFVLGPTSEGAVVSGVAGLAQRWAVGLGVGAVGGGLIGLAFRTRVLPEGLGNAFALAFATGVFATSNHFASESGIVAVITAGIIVGNLGVEEHRELLDFKEQLSVLLVGLLFVLLAADVKLTDVTALGLPAVGVVLVLMFVVRPVAVLASTAGSYLSTRERLFISWLGPRGIVAAAVASLFAQRLEANGMEGGAALRSLVFLVIAMTVVVQGATGGLVARWLHVLRKDDFGVVLLGANPFSRLLAKTLKELGEEVVLVDLNAEHCRVAEDAGLKVVFGNAMDERTLLRAQVDTRRACVAATGNESVNLLFARTLRRLFKVRRTLTLVHRDRLGVRIEDVRAAHAEVLFGRPIDLDDWAARAQRGELTSFQLTTTHEGALQPWLKEAPESLFLAFCWRAGSRVDLVGTETTLPRDAQLVLLAATADAEEAKGWLSRQPLFHVEVPAAASA